MIFRKKKAPATPGGQSVPRGRGDSGRGANSGSPGGDNPLARRFQPETEPATVDLADPARFHEPAAAEDPDTAPIGTDAGNLGRVISRDAATGKFYVHPGTGDCPVLLEHETVRAPTELRRGDTIQVGDAEFRLLGPQ